MTTYFPISNTVPQYENPDTGLPYSGAVLKAYAAGTSTPIAMATDYTGATTVPTITLNASGFPTVSGNVVIPHIAVNYKLALYPNAAAATSNTGALWIIDNLQIGGATGSFGSLTDVASAVTINLNSSATDYFNITGTTDISTVTLAEGSEVTVKFAGVLHLDNGAFLITGTGANITTAPGDTAALRGEAGGVVRVLWYRSSGGITGDPFASMLLHVQDQKSQNTSGGTFTSGAWRTRTLNTVLTNEIVGASLSANQITLPAGTYFVEAIAPCASTDKHQARLENVTDGIVLLTGMPGFAYTSSNLPDHSFVQGRFTISGIKTIELQHNCNTTGTTIGFGIAGNLGTEVYSDVRIWKVG